MKNLMKKTAMTAMLIMLAKLQALAFCGFYVAKADAKLFNKSSQVIIARDGSHTVLTMSNDYQGDAQDFAMVVPVPEVLKESDIRVVQQYIFDKFDAYTAPRLVEYWDPNPCVRYEEMTYSRSAMKSMPMMEAQMIDSQDSDMGVTIEASYTIGEYDILILSATESSGLKTWLTANGYKIPKDAEGVLQPYINDGMKFFVVKVNLEEQKNLGFTALRPLQIQFNSSRFMLPIRLGMANADGDQDLIIYTFTKKGRVETANYRTTKLPTDRDIPEFIQTKDMFGEFYKALYKKSWTNEGKNNVMLEYAWDVSSQQSVKCDPCPTPPISFAEMQEAGVWWLSPDNWSGSYVGDLFVTRLHVRYARSTFPQDLMFINTPNQEQFQGRYVIHHEATGDLNCSEGKNYKETLRMRKQKEMQELAALTGWSPSRFGYFFQPQSIPSLPDDAPKQGDGKDGQSIGAVDDPSQDQPKVDLPADGKTDVVSTDPQPEQPWVDTPESIAARQEFLQIAAKEQAEAGGKRGWLLGLAGAMFLGGIILRIRKPKKA